MKSKKKYLILAGFLVFVCICFGLFWNKPKLASGDIFAMDTYINMQIWSKGEELEESKQLVNDLDGQFTMYGEGSLAKINENSGTSTNASDELIEIVQETNMLSSQYGNVVDITAGKLTMLWGVSTDTPYLPTQDEALKAVSSIDYTKVSVDSNKKTIFLPEGTMLDLGSVAKGYTCDKLKELFDKREVTYAIVSMGSSSLLYGEKTDKSQFKVEVKNPDGGEALGIIKTDDTFISTSGGYERFFEIDGVKYSHIFDLKTGFPAESNLTSVTVLCNSGLQSDFLSTLIFIDGTEGLSKHLNAEDYKVIAATSDKKVYVSPSVDFVLDENSGYTIGELQ